MLNLTIFKSFQTYNTGLKASIFNLYLLSKSMKHFYTVFLFFIAFQVLAQDTKYETERIIWNGVSYPYRYHHLEQYFNYYPEKRPVASVDSTIINRNYVAVFEVQDNKFYLNNLLVSEDS